MSLLQFNTGIPPAVYARYYFDLLTLGDAVALPAIIGDQRWRRRRRLTPRLARRLRVLPVNAEARAEHLSSTFVFGTNSTLSGGGGGMMFDLPCTSLADEEVEDDASSSSSQQGRGTNSRSRRYKRRPRSVSPTLSSSLVGHLLYL